MTAIIMHIIEPCKASWSNTVRPYSGIVQLINSLELRHVPDRLTSAPNQMGPVLCVRAKDMKTERENKHVVKSIT